MVKFPCMTYFNLVYQNAVYLIYCQILLVVTSDEHNASHWRKYLGSVIRM